MKKFVLLFFVAFMSTYILAQTAGGTITRPSHRSQIKKTSSKMTKQQILQNLIENMVYVEGGIFMMGATMEQDTDANEDESPIRMVTLNSFKIGKYEVTQREWKAVMGNDIPWHPQMGDNYSIQLSWSECQIFISRLNSLTGCNFRLPTEAEWEFAAKGGNKTNRYKYAGGEDINDVAWYKDNSVDKYHQIGGKKSNELGLYDMSGNNFEWCSDWYGKYNPDQKVNPQGAPKPNGGARHVIRGGNVYSPASDCRLTSRGSCGDDAFSRPGLRLVLSVPN